jgi:CRISPR/Cas system-associated endoribonuclease Cas2
MIEYITQEKIDEQFPIMIYDINEEINRVKMWANENGYHVGTAVYEVVRNYRNQLRSLRDVLRMNVEPD